MEKYRFWDIHQLDEVRSDIVNNIEDIVSVIRINDDDSVSHKLNKPIEMAHIDGTTTIDKIVGVTLTFGKEVEFQVETPLGGIVNECTDGYCIDSLLELRNQLLEELITPICKKGWELVGMDESIYLEKANFVVSINETPSLTADVTYKAKVIEVNNLGDCLEVIALPENHTEPVRLTETNISTHSEFKALVELIERKKSIRYKWTAKSNDGSFTDESREIFDNKEECYNDMRNAALEKMKWNTEYREDFGDMEDGEYIGYTVRFSREVIIHESYSGIYIYKIVEVTKC
jgi:hypothetical protein